MFTSKMRAGIMPRRATIKDIRRADSTLIHVTASPPFCSSCAHWRSNVRLKSAVMMHSVGLLPLHPVKHPTLSVPACSCPCCTCWWLAACFCPKPQAEPKVDQMASFLSVFFSVPHSVNNEIFPSAIPPPFSEQGNWGCVRAASRFFALIE